MKTFFTFSLIILFQLLSIPSLSASNADLWQPDSARFQGSETDDLPLPKSIWEPVQIPFYLDATATAQAQEYLWFDFDYDYHANEGNIGVYLPRHMRNLSTYVNGRLIHSGRHHGDDEFIGWNQPVLIPIQSANLQEGINRISLGLRKGIAHTNLAQVIIGSHADLLPLWQRANFFQVEASLLAAIACFVMGFLAIGLWLKRPVNSEYLAFASGCFSWAVGMLFLYLPYSPVPAELWIAIGYVAVIVAGYSLSVFIALAMKFETSKWLKPWTYVAALGCIVILLLPVSQKFWFAMVFQGFAMLVLGYLCYRTLRVSFHAPTVASIWISIGIFVMLLFFLRDFYIFTSNLSDGRAVDTVLLLQLSVPLVLLIMFGYLVHQFGDALTHAETLNRELENRVAAAGAALEVSYAENRQMELRESAEQERQKIYRDLHDDVGSKLTSIIHTGDVSTHKNLAKSALESLREAIHRANYQSQTLQESLQSASEELEIRLQSAGLQFTFSGMENTPNLELDAAYSYHNARIFRELTSNILNHSKATSASLTISDVRDEFLTVKLIDNGIGFQPHIEVGKGLANVSHRMSEIGGNVQWLSDGEDSGCTVCLMLPLTVDPNS